MKDVFDSFGEIFAKMDGLFRQADRVFDRVGRAKPGISVSRSGERVVVKIVQLGSAKLESTLLGLSPEDAVVLGNRLISEAKAITRKT